MQTNKNIKGRAIFSDPEDVKERSLKLYTYLVCRVNLRNAPNKFGDNVRIFQHKDINLSDIRRTIGIKDDRTIKKYFEELENAGLIKFCPRDWKEEKFKIIKEEENEQIVEISYNERWRIRNKHKTTYYEIPVSKEMLFRKIPKETLIKMNEVYQLKELEMKIYITLVNYQEDCIIEGQKYKTFTCKDLRDIIGYTKDNKTDKKIAEMLNHLSSLGLIEIEKGRRINQYGVEIDVYVLNQANFYINFDLMDFETSNENSIEPEQIEKIKNYDKELYSETFN